MRSAALAWLKKKKKEREKNNLVFHAIASLPPYAHLLTLLVVPTGSAGSPKCVYTLRIPERARLLASLLFLLKYVCNGPICNFC